MCKVVVVVQCRLSSTRLPGKALLPFGKKTVLEWTLAAMKKVRADDYYLAVDKESESELKPVALKNGWKFYAGSQKDVLQRFCDVIEISGADVVVRATADNPFLFFDAAQEMVDEYFESVKKGPIDYFTYSGLPHGSGVEMFDAHSLMKAKELTTLEYDHEHVGPALYNHPDRFKSVFAAAPEKYNFPKLRTTIDTSLDYRRAAAALDELGNDTDTPVPSEAVIKTFSLPYISHPVLLVPSTQKGHGTGHLRRCLSLALEKKWFIYVEENNSITQRQDLLDEAFSSGLKEWQIEKNLDNSLQYSLVAADSFCSSGDLINNYFSKIPAVSLDEGCDDTECFEYLLDIIPSSHITRKGNYFSSDFIPLPENRKNIRKEKIENALVAFGGEDPSSLSEPAAIALAENGIKVTVVSDPFPVKDSCSSLITFIPPVKNLKEKIFEFDLVVTHYGFTAFESAGAGCAVILCATTELHRKLSVSEGFVCAKKNMITGKYFKKLLSDSSALYRKNSGNRSSQSLGDFIEELSLGNHFDCPVCRNAKFAENPVVARTKERTFRKCRKCGMTYISWTKKEIQTQYNRAYFYDDYKKQYGKTYEEDFSSIKKSCMLRIKHIELIFQKKLDSAVLDIGCALGPFLDAAHDRGWDVYGTDISKDAVSYVCEKFKYNAVVSNFPDDDLLSVFTRKKFDVVTMWYVIEHFQNLKDVLEKVGMLVEKGGVFAFSTPSLSGITGKFSRQLFFEQSPSDHFSIWQTETAGFILKKYGFKVEKIVSTGIHGERFPLAKKLGWKRGSFPVKILDGISRIFKLGDTMEIYCRKI